MATKVISFTLDSASVRAAIKEFEAYRKDLKEKCVQLRKKIADKIQEIASDLFANAELEDILYGPDGTNDVVVSVTHDENLSVVIAAGTQAVFIEFGAGVYHNAAVGSSLHPLVTGSDPDFKADPIVSTLTIGSYGQGKGAQPAWGFYRDPGDKNTLVLTRGTKAAMPMYTGAKSAIAMISELVQEVFGSD